MNRRIAAGLVAVVLVATSCGNEDADIEVVPAPTPTATAIPEATPEPTATAIPEATPEPTATAIPEATPEPIPQLRVWPVTEPTVWPRTADEAAEVFARHAALGERTAEPRPALRSGSTATAELPRLAEDGSTFGVASTIHMQQIQLDDGSAAWVVISAQSDDIVVNSPAFGELLARGTVIEGEGQGFEGTIVFRVEDQNGPLGLALAQGGALGENLPFETQLLFDQRPASGNWAILVGYTTSAVDGSLSALTMLPMRLVDGS
ncbi:Gmad2 immunoglobulin-like domain-containing protein [Candidatus Poriferisocius sp.]|uniref:Gmad2 immunoglobulin-like domain-containing protein n=1 Tax=Candidatus Poriferisocius sp. TaxID=3101276 RepID=UPI003B01B76C